MTMTAPGQMLTAHTAPVTTPDSVADFGAHSGGVPCFTRGSLIATTQGTKAVETLRQGDTVLTRDNGLQQISWIGCRPLEQKELAQQPEHNPICIRKGALGNGLPLHDLWTSPNHRILVQNLALRARCGTNEALVAAADLVGAPGISQCKVARTDYFHLMFDRHEVILSNGAWSESFQPTLATLGAFHDAQRAEVLALFPELATLSGLQNYGEARGTIGATHGDILDTLRTELAG